LFLCTSAFEFASLACVAALITAETLVRRITGETSRAEDQMAIGEVSVRSESADSGRMVGNPEVIQPRTFWRAVWYNSQQPGTKRKK
jgi:hypothetical protein